MKQKLQVVGAVLVGSLAGVAGIYIKLALLYTFFFPQALNGWMYQMLLSLAVWHGAILGGVTGAAYALAKTNKSRVAATTCIVGGSLELVQLLLWRPSLGQPSVSMLPQIVSASPWLTFLVWAILLLIYGMLARKRQISIASGGVAT